MDILFYLLFAAVWFIIGYFLGRKSKREVVKYDGILEISEHDSSQIHQLEVTTEPEVLGKQATMVLKVKKV